MLQNSKGRIFLRQHLENVFGMFWPLITERFYKTFPQCYTITRKNIVKATCGNFQNSIKAYNPKKHFYKRSCNVIC